MFGNHAPAWCARTFCIAGLVFIPTLVCGCSKKAEGDNKKVGEARKNLGAIYRAYKMAEDESKHPPKNEQELVPFLEKAGGSNDSLRASSDGEPFVIIWGVSLQQKGPASQTNPADRKPEERKSTKTTPGQGVDSAPAAPILAYEQKGSKEGRLALLTTGPVMLLKDDVFRSAKFANNHKPN